MWLLVGLGNPGPRYAKTRHNFGWMVLEALAKSRGLSFREDKNLRAFVLVFSEKAILLKPLTYMNLSGKAVFPASRKFEIPPERILVIHDDLDLPLGRLKLVPKGGAGGHRGVLSIIETLGTDSFPRLKLGIGRPPEGGEVVDYVLAEFEPEEWSVVEKVLAIAVKALEMILEEGLAKAMNLYNRKDLIQN